MEERATRVMTLPPRERADSAERARAAPAVSVCIVNRDCRDLLEACLTSLLEQPQGVPFEVIVVDNASTDGAADLVAERFPQATLIRNERNQGFARANNQAAAAAQGRCLFFLNNDTEVAAGTLAELVEFQENHPEAWLIGPRLRGRDGQVQRGPRRFPGLGSFLHRTCLLRWTGIFRRRYREYCRETPEHAVAQPVEVLMGAALLVRRDRFCQLGGWNEKFFFGGEDLELCLRARARGAVVHVPVIEVLHHGRACTRRFIAQATKHIAAGFVKYLRQKGTSRLGLAVYKFVITIDTPLQIAVKVGQFAWQALRGRWPKAAKCWNDLKGLAAFLGTGLWSFWRA